MSATILLIEDNAANSELMSYLLRAHNYETIAAWTGEQGLELVKQGGVDLVLCDIQLPGIDGMEVARRLKAHPIGKRLPVLAVTALAMVGDRDRILSAGFDGYLSKPLDPRAFVSKVEAHIPAHLRRPAREEEAVPPSSEGSLEQSSTKETVLLIDDEPTNLEVLRSTLEPFGYHVLEAASGNQAWEILQSAKPDLIIADLHLHRERPFSFLERLKQDEKLQKIPFVFLSSTSDKQSLVETAREKGALTFLFRPISPTTLINEVLTALGRS